MPSVERPISARLEQLLRDLVRRVSALERPVRRVVAAGDTLPTSPDEGEQFDLRFAHDGLYRRCTWRQALNNGNGAWAVEGPPLVSNQTAGWTYASPTSWAYTTMPGISITVPVSGTYLLSAQGSIRCNQDGVNECNVTLGINGGNWLIASHVCTRHIWDTFTGGGGPYLASLGAGTTVTLRAGTNGPSNEFIFGGAVWFSLQAQPVELRP